MITNGTLLNEDSVSILKDLEIFDLQITIDGTKQTHNSRRTSSCGFDSYTPIMRFVESSAGTPFVIQLRVNVDKNNVNDIVPELINLAEIGTRENVLLSFARVEYFSSNCARSLELMYTDEEFYPIRLHLEDIAVSLGLNIGEDLSYPTAIESYCSVTLGNGIVLDPEGRLYQCMSDCMDPSLAFSSIMAIDSFDEVLDVLSKTEYCNSSLYFPDECTACSVLPLCLGGCMLRRRLHLNPCPEVKYHFLDQIKAFIVKNQN